MCSHIQFTLFGEQLCIRSSMISQDRLLHIFVTALYKMQTEARWASIVGNTFYHTLVCIAHYFIRSNKYQLMPPLWMCDGWLCLLCIYVESVHSTLFDLSFSLAPLSLSPLSPLHTLRYVWLCESSKKEYWSGKCSAITSCEWPHVMWIEDAMYLCCIWKRFPDRSSKCLYTYIYLNLKLHSYT